MMPPGAARPAFPRGNSVVDAVAPVCSVMSIIAAWPALRYDKPPLKRASPQLLVQLFIFAGLAFCWVGVLRDRLQYLHNTRAGDFARGVFCIQYMLYLAMFWTIPLIWMDAPKMVTIWRQWEEYQGHLESACSGGLPSLSSTSWLCALVLLVVWPPLMAAPIALLPEAELPWQDSLFYAYATLAVLFLNLIWMQLLHALRQAALLLTYSCFEQAHGTRGSRSALLRRFCGLWVGLRDVILAVGEAGGVSMLAVQGLHVLSLLLCGFQIAFSSIKGFTPLAVIISSIGVATLIGMALICDGGHRVTVEMQRIARFIETLPAEDLDSDSVHELELFRRTLSLQRASVMLCGFVPLDRALLGEVLVVLMTYLVVLLQFSL